MPGFSDFYSEDDAPLAFVVCAMSAALVMMLVIKLATVIW